MTESKTKKSEPWTGHIAKILDGSNDHLFSSEENNKTFKYLLGCLETLMSRAPLSEKQAKLLVKNIKLRVPGYGDFEWTGTIMLTDRQWRFAKNDERLKAYNKTLKIKNSAINQMKDVVNEVLEEHGYDLDLLVQLRNHIRLFVPEAKPGVVEVAKPVVVVKAVEPTVGPSADDLLGQFGFRNKAVERLESDLNDVTKSYVGKGT